MAPGATWRLSSNANGARRRHTLMRRIKAAARSAKPAQSRRRAQRRRANPPEEPETDAEGVAADRPLHRMRFLRAAMSVARPDAVAAPAHRAAREMARLRCDEPRLAAPRRNGEGHTTMPATRPAPAVRSASSVCPLEIDTGAFIRNLRAEKGTDLWPRRSAAWSARHFSATLQATRAGARCGRSRAQGYWERRPMQFAARLAKDKLGAPKWTPQFPRGESCPSCVARRGGPAGALFSKAAPAAPWGRRAATTARTCAPSRRGFSPAPAIGWSRRSGRTNCAAASLSPPRGLTEIAEAKARELAQRLARPGDKIPGGVRHLALRGADEGLSGGRAFRRSTWSSSCASTSRRSSTCGQWPRRSPCMSICSLRKNGLADMLLELAQKCATG